MDKFLELMTDIGRTLRPVAQDLLKTAGSVLLKLAGKGGQLALSAAKSGAKTVGGRRLLRKGRRLLRHTAFVSGSIAVLSCAGLILLRKR